MSIANGHTPRPWHLTPDGRAVWADSRRLADIAPANGHATPNGNLIVSSPELLAQLEIAVASGKSWRGISEARAAIAKARGQNV